MRAGFIPDTNDNLIDLEAVLPFSIEHSISLVNPSEQAGHCVRKVHANVVPHS